MLTAPANLKRRKREVLDFIRHGLFTRSEVFTYHEETQNSHI